MSGTVQFERLSECIVVAHGYEVDHLVEVFLDNLRRLYTSGLATYDNSHPLHYRRTLRPPPRFSRQARSTNGTRVILYHRSSSVHERADGADLREGLATVHPFKAAAGEVRAKVAVRVLLPWR